MEQPASHAAPQPASPPGSPSSMADAGGPAGAAEPMGAAEPTGAPRSDEDRAFAAIVASVERLDELGLATEAGLATVEPATTFGLD